MMNIPKLTWTIFSLRTLNSLSWSATMPFLGVYLEVVRGVSLSIIGVAYLASGLLTLASELIGGRLTDSIGPKKVMLMGYSSSVISALLLGALIDFKAPVELILILYPMFNLFRAVTQPSTSAIIANQEPKYVRTGFSMLNIGANLGFAIGPALGGALSQAYSYGSVFLFSAAIACVVGVITQLRIAPGLLTLDGDNAMGQALAPKRLSLGKDRSLIYFLFLALGSYLALGYEITPMSLYVAGFLHFSNLEIGNLFALNGLIIVIFQIPITRFFERTKYLVLPLVLSSIFVASAYFVASRSVDFPEYVLVMCAVTVGEIFLSVPSQTVVTLFSRSGNRGTYQGYYYASITSGRSLASFLGPLSFAILSFDPGIAWILIGSFSLAVGTGYALLSKRLQRDYELKKLEGDENFSAKFDRRDKR